MQHRSSLLLGLAALVLALSGTARAATRTDDGLLHVGEATTLSFRDMVRPAYWVVRHHHRVWMPDHHRR